MKWNEVTWYSRIGAIILFVGVLPVLTFYIGMQYEKLLQQTQRTQNHFQVINISDEPIGETGDDEIFECDGDARICSDGSTVGRTGPDCEFTACPLPDATSGEVTTYLGGTATALSVSVSPKEIVSDSRCPIGVTCIWAGTVEVRTVLATAVSHGEHTMKLNEAQVFGEYNVTLTEVTPPKTEAAIPSSSYRFTYEITKR